MRQIIFLIISFLFVVPIFGQDHSISLDEKPNFTNFYLFPDIQNEVTYWFELEGTSLTKKKLTEFKLLNTETQETEKQTLKSPLSFKGKFLRAYYHQGDFLFLSHDIENDQVVMITMATTKEMEQQVVNIPLEKGEEVYITHHRGNEIFILSKQFKSRLLKVQLISLSNGEISTASQVMEGPDSRAFDARFTPPTPNRISPYKAIDYSKHNHILDFTGNEKVFFDNDEVVLLIEHRSTYLISLYKFNIATGKTSMSRYKSKHENGWNSFNATYYNEMLYRIMSNRFGTYFDVVNTKTEETVLSKEYTKKSDYPFDFQVSNFINQDTLILPDKKSIIRTLGSSNLFVYPEIYENAVNIYMGSITTPKYDGLKPVSSQLEKYSIGFISYNYKKRDYNQYDKPIANLCFSENDLKCILVETSIDKNGQLQKEMPFKEIALPNYLKCSLAVRDIQKQAIVLDIAIHGFENSYYGIFYKKSEKKIFIKKIVF